MQRSWNRDLAQEILVQRSCTSGPTGSWCTHPDREISRKRSAYRDLAQVVLQDPDAEILARKKSAHRDPVRQDPVEEILTQTSCTRDPHTPILHQCSCGILLRRSWRKHLAQEILIHRSCTSGALEAPDTAQASCTRDPHTVILHKSAYRILVRRSWQGHLAQETPIERSCIQDPAEEILPQTSCIRDPHTPILHQCSYRILLRRS